MIGRVKWKEAVWFFLLCSFLNFVEVARAEVPVPPLRARVTDLSSTLSPNQKDRLENYLKDFEIDKGSQVAVLIVPSTKPESIEQYSMRVVERWELGRAGVDDGVLLLIAKKDRRLRIEVGYGLEAVLTDATAKRIIDEIITPHFKRGDFYLGVFSGAQKITGVISGEPLPTPTKNYSKKEGQKIFGAILFLLVYVIFLFVLPFILKSQTYTLGGSRYSYHYRRYRGFGGGGFSGGGGSFGGGGASGGW